MLSTPYPYIDLDILENNLKVFTQRLNEENIEHWPHIKTHRSVEIAKMQLQNGATGITCAKIAEATVMAEGGINKILLAYSLVGQDKMERLGKLMDICDVTVTVDNMISAKQLSDLGILRNEKIKVLIEVLTDINRGGVSKDKILDFAKEIIELKGISLTGVFAYNGISKPLGTIEALSAYATEEKEQILSVKKTLEDAGINVEISSVGSTLTGNFPKELSGVTQCRSGSYVFNDYHYAKDGCIDLKHCAMKVKATVISKPCDGMFTIDAGSKTLSSDGKEKGFGYIIQYPNAKISKLNEEHGFVEIEDNSVVEIGDTVDIIPFHSCVVSNLHDYLFAFRNGKFERKITVDARGKSY